MKKNNLKSNLNMIFSSVVFLFCAIIITNNFFAVEGEYQGSVERISCIDDSKRKGVSSFYIKIEFHGGFKNRINSDCDIFRDIKIGDYVTVKAKGHSLININHEGSFIFNEKLVELRRGEVFFLIYLVFFISAADVFYRIYSKFVKNYKGQVKEP